METKQREASQNINGMKVRTLKEYDYYDVNIII